MADYPKKVRIKDRNAQVYDVKAGKLYHYTKANKGEWVIKSHNPYIARAIKTGVMKVIQMPVEDVETVATPNFSDMLKADIAEYIKSKGAEPVDGTKVELIAQAETL